MYIRTQEEVLLDVHVIDTDALSYMTLCYGPQAVLVNAATGKKHIYGRVVSAAVLCSN